MGDFGMRLAEARKARGMTQEQLAQQLHVSRQTVSHWENGRALPDIAMAQRIADELGLLEVGNAVENDASDVNPSAGAGRPPTRRIVWVVGCVVLMVGLLCGILLGTRMPRAYELPLGQAVITVTAEAEEAPFLINEIFPGGGWDVGFNFANVSDVPFRPSYLIARYYAGDELVNAITVTYEQMLPWMASDMLRQGEAPLRWPFGTDRLYVTRMDCILYGTDANGNELSFSGGVQYQRPPEENEENVSY